MALGPGWCAWLALKHFSLRNPLQLPKPVLSLALGSRACTRREEDRREREQLRGRVRMRMLLTKGQVGAVMGRKGSTIK